MKKGKVWTYLADITPLLEEEAYRKALEKVPDFRREKAQRLRFREGQAQSVGAWLLLMKAVKNTDSPEMQCLTCPIPGGMCWPPWDRKGKKPDVTLRQ